MCAVGCLSGPPRRMEEPMSGIEITQALVLAAVDRAVHHQQTGTAGAAPVWAVYEHAGVSQRSGAGRRLRGQLAVLDGSWLARGKHRSVETWALTPAGKRRLSRLRRNDELPGLPESPQHRAWREAHALAGQRIEGFRVALLEEMERAQGLLGDPSAAGGPSSDVVFELGERLHRACRRLGSATHCLYEWGEPDDAHADVDDRTDPGDRVFDPRERALRHARRAGRRNTRLWRATPRLVYLGQAIREERERQGMSTTALAGKAGVARRQIALLEAGEVDPDYRLLLTLARTLRLRPGTLVDRAREAEEGSA